MSERLRPGVTAKGFAASAPVTASGGIRMGTASITNVFMAAWVSNMISDCSTVVLAPAMGLSCSVSGQASAAKDRLWIREAVHIC